MERVIRYTYAKIFHTNSQISLMEQFYIVSATLLVLVSAITLLVLG